MPVPSHDSSRPPHLNVCCEEMSGQTRLKFYWSLSNRKRYR